MYLGRPHFPNDTLAGKFGVGSLHPTLELYIQLLVSLHPKPACWNETEKCLLLKQWRILACQQTRKTLTNYSSQDVSGSLSLLLNGLLVWKAPETYPQVVKVLLATVKWQFIHFLADHVIFFSEPRSKQFQLYIKYHIYVKLWRYARSKGLYFVPHTIDWLSFTSRLESWKMQHTPSIRYRTWRILATWQSIDLPRTL